MRRHWPRDFSKSDYFKRLNLLTHREKSVLVVMPVFNGEKYISEAIESILDLADERIQFVIVDGGSTDSTCKTIKKYEKFLSAWLSEKDRGQSDAILKGLKLARADYFTWLNADDLLNRDFTGFFDYASQGLAISGLVENFGLTDPFVTKNKNLSLEEYIKFNSTTVFHQPGVVWPYDEYLFDWIDPNRHYCFDQQLLLGYLLKYGRVIETELNFAKFRLHEDSKTCSQSKKFREEYIEILSSVIASSINIEESVLRELRKKRWVNLLEESLSSLEKSDLLRILKEIFHGKAELPRYTLSVLVKILCKKTFNAAH